MLQAQTDFTTAGRDLVNVRIGAGNGKKSDPKFDRMNRCISIIEGPAPPSR